MVVGHPVLVGAPSSLAEFLPDASIRAAVGQRAPLAGFWVPRFEPPPPAW